MPAAHRLISGIIRKADPIREQPASGMGYACAVSLPTPPSGRRGLRLTLAMWASSYTMEVRGSRSKQVIGLGI